MTRFVHEMKVSEDMEEFQVSAGEEVARVGSNSSLLVLPQVHLTVEP